jgi:hypothetical protein
MKPITEPAEACDSSSTQRHREFIARALAVRDEARRNGEYIDATEVHAELQSMLDAAKSHARAVEGVPSLKTDRP